MDVDRLAGFKLLVSHNIVFVAYVNTTPSLCYGGWLVLIYVEKCYLLGSMNEFYIFLLPKLFISAFLHSFLLPYIITCHPNAFWHGTTHPTQPIL